MSYHCVVHLFKTLNLTIFLFVTGYIKCWKAESSFWNWDHLCSLSFMGLSALIALYFSFHANYPIAFNIVHNPRLPSQILISSHSTDKISCTECRIERKTQNETELIPFSPNKVNLHARNRTENLCSSFRSLQSSLLPSRWTFNCSVADRESL